MREGNISHYRLVEMLGEGAMGEVYRAEDTRLKRTVALKFLTAGRETDAALRQRFLNEAQAAASLDHSNICTVYEVDEHDGEIFIAMAFIDGPTLQKKISQRPLPLAEAVEIAIQIGEGLEAAHERGIVHRDIKSSNVMLTSRGQAKITDFGLATLANQTRLTHAGAIVGTPGYMSPEQARSEGADARSDLWALGVVLYEMVSGQLPFGGNNAASAIFAILHREPEPLTAVRSGVPLELERIVAKALAKDPAHRYQHAADILVDLRSVKRLLESRPQSVSSEREAAREAVVIGQTLGHYQLEEKLGEGGMGMVFRALDSHLGRAAAIKVLKAGKAGVEQKKRFVQEAKAASALNHPNIVHIYDISESGGVDYIAMEFVDGVTLDRLIPPKGMKIADALRMAVSIADALGKAHAAGIVHRDLKPSNIMVQSDGVVKVLDFGLAKLLEAGAGATIPPDERPQSDDGTIVGTLAYMSPEQAQGAAVDSRSDIFSFGVVLYEMLSGRRAFQGPSRGATIAALLAQEPPPLADLAGGIPIELDNAILRCLRKDPRRRWQSFTDLKVVLEDLKEESDSGRLGRAAAGPAKRRRALWTAAFATLAVLAAGAAAWVIRGRQTAARGPVEWQQLTDFTDSATQPALSPDGRFLTFVRGPGTFFTQGQIYVKLLPDGEPVQLTHDDRLKMSPIFTPDGSRIAYTVAFPWDTWIVPVLGGEPRLMLANASGLRWIAPDRLLFSEIKSGAHMALVTSRESRAEERDVYVPPHERGMAHRSALSPDGKSVLLVEMDNGGFLPCRLARFDGSSSGRRVGPQPGACTEVAWSPDGKWMYLNSESGGKFHIWRQPSDGGDPERITSGANDEQGIALAPDGRSLITSVGQQQSDIWFRDAAGERQVSSQGFATAPLLSADGKRIYYISKTEQFDAGELWMWDLDSNHGERLLPGIVIGGSENGFDASPDNKRLVYCVAKPGQKSEIWLAALDGRFPPRRLSLGDDSAPKFAPDGDIIFRASEGKTNYLYRMRADGTGREKLSASPILALALVSPDGKWASVWGPTSEEDSPNAELLLPTDGGPPVRVCDRCRVAWAPDGKYFYIHLGDMEEGIARTYAIPLRRGSMLPDLPPGGVKSSDDLKKLPSAQTIDEVVASPGTSPSTYAFTKTSVHRNLFRIPLP